MGDRLLITVHGIRTYGAWQDRLENLVNETYQGTIKVNNYRYGFFTLFALFFPPLRWLATRRFQADLLALVAKKPWVRIDIVAHSFGTHLVGLGLLRLPPAKRPQINTIIFAGSILKPTFPIRGLVGSAVSRVVNDCGIKDDVLVLNQIINLFCGMAGRVGFIGMENGGFRNRYFDFGHSGYFGKSESDDVFMKRFWIPLFSQNSHITRHDERGRDRWRDVKVVVLENLAFTDLLKIGALIFVLGLGIRHYRSIEANGYAQAQSALSRRIALDAASLRAANGDIELVTLLGIQSMKYQPQLGNDEIVRSSAKLLPKIVWSHSQNLRLNAFASSSDGRFVASEDAQNTLRVYLASDGRELWNMNLGPEAFSFSLAFSLDDRYIVVGTGNASTTVFDTATGRKIKVLSFSTGGRYPAAVTGLAFSPGGDKVAVVSGGEAVRVFMWADGTLLSTFPHEAGTEVSFSPDSNYVMVEGPNMPARLFDVSSGREPVWLRNQKPNSVSTFSRDGKLLALGDGANGLLVIDLESKKYIVRLQRDSPIKKLYFTEDGTRLISLDNNSLVQMLDTHSWKVLAHFSIPKATSAETLSHSGKYIAVGDRSSDSLRVFDSYDGNEVTRTPAPGGVTAMAFSPGDDVISFATPNAVARITSDRLNIGSDSEVLTADDSARRGLFASSKDGKYRVERMGTSGISIIDRQTAAPVFHFELNSIPFLSMISPDDRSFFVKTGPAGEGTVFNLLTGKPTVEVLGWLILMPAFSNDGKYIALSEARNTSTVPVFRVEVFEALSGNLVSTLPSSGMAFAIAFSSDAHEIAIGHVDEAAVNGQPRPVPSLDDTDFTAATFDVKTGKILQTLNAGTSTYSIAFSPDGQFVVTGTDKGHVRVFANANGTEIERFLLSDSISSASVSQNSKYAAVVNGKSGSVVFDLQKKEEIIDASDHAADVQFTSDSSQYVSKFSALSKSIENPIAAKDLIESVCPLLTRNLTPDEWRRYVGADIPYQKTCGYPH